MSQVAPCQLKNGNAITNEGEWILRFNYKSSKKINRKGIIILIIKDKKKDTAIFLFEMLD